MRLRFPLLALIVASLLSLGCFGQSKVTGKHADHDKPKPVDGSN